MHWKRKDVQYVLYSTSYMHNSCTETRKHVMYSTVQCTYTHTKCNIYSTYCMYIHTVYITYQMYKLYILYTKCTILYEHDTDVHAVTHVQEPRKSVLYTHTMDEHQQGTQKNGIHAHHSIS